ncbi:ATP-binding protein [Brucepastera parasyntrophica]|uniref:ATP-binding protein n=1 Tax=Brucepastera parasyntrophica TaxID=2880008 RepID=UPI00210EA447|nr:ATP-binding protein [Brucepastera parasyntrophica]ULQ60411.1 ATP-binding protein [Brucepastera parasyntrophica]
MEKLKYVIEDSTIAELLGTQNFTNKESAILELVKNSYDAKASKLTISFEPNMIVMTDDGMGMGSKDIKSHWMHIGKSNKKYEIIDFNHRKRVLSGSKGIGRFALSRLGEQVAVYSKKRNLSGIVWDTDWNSSTISEEKSLKKHGTRIEIMGLRDKWGPKAISDLSEFLAKTYNDDTMEIDIHSNGEITSVSKYFPDPQLGINCLSSIQMTYDSANHTLRMVIKSDEFLDKAREYHTQYDICKYEVNTNILEEFKTVQNWDLSTEELSGNLHGLGDFSAIMLFNINSPSVEMEKFLYKYNNIPNSLTGGMILYRNAFSISSYEGKKDWLGLGKRSRQSPAAASHPTGAWRVRENQLAGKVEIDKKNNRFLRDLSNRQGLDENVFYELFVEIILVGIKEFERYRQEIIRSIDKKNNSESEEKAWPISEKVLSNPSSVSTLSKKKQNS